MDHEHLTKSGALYRIAYAQPDAIPRFTQWYPFSNGHSTSEYFADVPPVMLSGPVLTDKDLDRL